MAEGDRGLAPAARFAIQRHAEDNVSSRHRSAPTVQTSLAGRDLFVQPSSQHRRAGELRHQPRQSNATALAAGAVWLITCPARSTGTERVTQPIPGLFRATGQPEVLDGRRADASPSVRRPNTCSGRSAVNHQGATSSSANPALPSTLSRMNHGERCLPEGFWRHVRHPSLTSPDGLAHAGLRLKRQARLQVTLVRCKRPACACRKRSEPRRRRHGGLRRSAMAPAGRSGASCGAEGGGRTDMSAERSVAAQPAAAGPKAGRKWI